MNLLLFFVTCHACCQPVDEKYTQLYEMFKSAARFESIYPREKVYVHFDNTSYEVGDTIWYKAYVVRASSLHPSDLSKVLYVELLDAEGEQMERQILRVNERGSACGCIALNTPVLAGYHEVRAYTREMLNWGNSVCFSRVFPVFYKAEEKIRSKHGMNWKPVRLSVPYVSKPGRNESVPRPYEMKYPEDRLLSFYPEGGNMAKDVAQRVAFKLTDGRGRPANDTVFVYRNNGEFITCAVHEYEGMGTFDLPKGFEGGYACLNRLKTGLSNNGLNKYVIPSPVSDYSLRVDITEGGLSVKILGSNSILAQNKFLGLGIFNRDRATYFDTLTLNAPLVLTIPMEKMHGGVNRLDLFDAREGCLVSRIFWVPLNKDNRVHKAMVEVMQSESEEDGLPAKLKIHVTDCNGHPIQEADLSVSVTKDGILSNRNVGIGEYLLLASEVRGYIHRPDLYFEKNDAQHRRMLDLLMMVQGWSAQSFDVMSNKETFEALHPIEKKIMLSGVVCKGGDLKRPFGNVNMTVDSYPIRRDSVGENSSSMQVCTDEKGRFAIDMDNKKGEWMMNFRPKNAGMDWSRIAISQWYAPTPKPYFEPELELNPNSGMEEKSNTNDKYTLSRSNKYGMVRTLKYYDILRLGERLKDNGFKSSIGVLTAMHLLDGNTLSDIGLYVPQTISEYIKSMDKSNQEEKGSPQKFRIQQETKKYKSGNKHRILYKGTLVKVYVDDRLVEYVPDLDSLGMEGIRSASLVQTIESEEISNSQRPKYSLYLYTIQGRDKELPANQGRVESRYAHAYTPQRNFYAPDYNNFALGPEIQQKRTLYWNPCAQTDSKGEAFIVPLPYSKNTASWNISVQGISADGVLIDCTKSK